MTRPVLMFLGVRATLDLHAAPPEQCLIYFVCERRLNKAREIPPTIITLSSVLIVLLHVAQDQRLHSLTPHLWSIGSAIR